MLDRIMTLALVVLLVGLAAATIKPHTEWRPRDEVRVPAEKWAALCTEDYRQARHIVVKDMEKVQWRRVPDGSLAWGAVALYDTITNTIFVTVQYQDTNWVLSHELVHYLLAGPPGPESHPFDPFSFPCQLQTYQHVSGGVGIMGMHYNGRAQVGP